MEKSSGWTNAVLSYYPNEEWGVKLAEVAPSPVHLLLTWRKRGWDATKWELPDNLSVVVEPGPQGYRAVVLPLVEPFDGVAQEMCSVLLNYAVMHDVPAIVTVDTEKEEVMFEVLKKQFKRTVKRVAFAQLKDVLAGIPDGAIKEFRVKQRWLIAKHPAWSRHCSMLSQLLSKHGEDEPHGTLVDLDSGDGALLEFLRSRFGGLDVSGKCWHEEERSLGRGVIPNLPLVAGMTESDIRDSEYLTCGDAQPGQEELVRDLIVKHAKVRGVMSIQKEARCPSVFDILESFRGWDILETASHYLLTWEVKK
jgi:hypothetical protein